ncbi:MAG TPA: M23 family metallopeptidase [Saprospiraceae bacterium]|nr:M23 family metallopeptidase [Saprospiraceae bacterium]
MSEYPIDTVSRKSIADKYRLAVIDEEDLREVRSFRLSLLNVYMIVSAFFLITIIGVVFLIFFTPLKRLVPGYGDISNNVSFLELSRQLKEIEETLEAQELYNESLRKLLTSSGGRDPSHDAAFLAENLRTTDIGDRAGTILPEDISDRKSTRILGSLFFVPPVTGSISAGFLDVEDHYGVDILASQNTPIKTIMDGIVIFADYSVESGHTIAVQHPNNIISVYKHNSVLLKKTGDRLHAGEAIAIIGNSGTLSFGPHLHFELWFDGYPVDPVKYMSFN